MYNLNGYIQALKDEEAGVRAHGRCKGNVLLMP